MPLPPAELEAGRICYDKSDIVEVAQLCILQDEKLVMEKCLRFQEASTARPGRRTVRIVAAWCALIFLYFILNTVYSHILRWYGDFAFEWLSIRSPACIAPTWYDVRPSMDEDAEQPHAPGKIPQYVLDYAPYVHLYSGEQFWPCDIAEHLLHTTPELNYTPIDGEQQVPNLTNLDRLNQYEGGRNVFLTSKDDVEDRPDWLSGAKNIPANFTADLRDQSLFRSRHSTATNEDRIQNGRSDAPAVLITVNKGDGVVDAFWFFFYSYNLGNMVLNVRWGNHIGDWEHTLVRFQDGQPVAVFFSEHNFGSAYTYDAVEKIGKRVSSCQFRYLRLASNLAIARHLLSYRHARDVRHRGQPTLHSAPRSSPRRDRPRPSLGPSFEYSHLHLRFSIRYT